MKVPCNLCRGWWEASVRQKQPPRRLCPYTGKFVTSETKVDNTSCEYWAPYKRVYCPDVGGFRPTISCLKYINPTVCKSCRLGYIIREFRRLYRDARTEVATRYEKRRTDNMNVTDGRDQIKEAVKVLNESGLLPEKVKLDGIDTAVGEDLVLLINKFLDAVELIPANKEYLIPEIVYKTYNAIVSKELVFLDEKVNDIQVIIHDRGFAFRRRKLPLAA